MSNITVVFHKSLIPYTNGIKTIELNTDTNFSILNDCINLFPDLEKVVKKVKFSTLEDIAIIHDGKIITIEQIFFPTKKDTTYYLVPMFKGNGIETILIGAIVGFITSTSLALIQGASLGQALLRGLIGGAFGALSAGAFQYFKVPILDDAYAGIYATQAGIASYAAAGAVIALGSVVQNMLAPITPAGKSQAPDSADRINNDAFNSQINTANQGQPIPLNYGMVRIGGHYLSADVETVTIPKATQVVPKDETDEPETPVSDPYNPCPPGYEWWRGTAEDGEGCRLVNTGTGAAA